MSTAFNPVPPRHLVLRAETAADMMTMKPVSIHQNATVREAAAFLIEKDISAAPVIDDAGRPVGVLSRSDIVRYEQDPAASATHEPEFYHIAELLCPPALRKILHVQRAEHIAVREIMTPTVISVSPEDTVLSVVAEMLAFKVHRLFVIDEAGVLVGVIGTFDVLRKLHK